MSLRYKGALLSATPPTVNADGFGNAKGIWTMQQQFQYEGSGTWPSPFTPSYVEDVFSTYLYTGNGTGSTTTNTITNGLDLATEGGLVWLKRRKSAYNHLFFDTSRGVKKEIYSNTADAELTRSTTGLTSFNTTGFTLTGDSDPWNLNAELYSSWSFKKKQKFFDIVTYTGNGTARTISHNLGSVPGCIMVKRLDASGAWRVYHRSLNATYYLGLNETSIAAQASTIWNNTEPTSTVFSVGTSSNTNASGGTYVAYLFAHDAGGFGDNSTDNIITCGSYTGNGTSNGPTITLGYEPQWVLIKSTTVAGSHWYLMDDMREMAQGTCKELYANLDASEISQPKTILPTPTGFKVASVDPYINNGSSTYIYIAIRRGPMKTPTDGTKVFAPAIGVSSSSFPYMINETSFTVDAQFVANRTSIENKYHASRMLGTGRVLYSNLTNVESTGDYPAWDRQTGVGSNVGNSNLSSYITWNFRRAPSFFDVICYTGDGTSSRTMSHNLKTSPELIITKARDGSGGRWPVWFKDWGNTDFFNYLELNQAPSNRGFNYITATSSTTYSLGTSNSYMNAADINYVSYLFATCPGVSKVSSYVGNGTSQTIDCGFTTGARFVLIKRTDTTGDWLIIDTVRGLVLGNDPTLTLNTTAAEVNSTSCIDPDSSGFIVNQQSANNLNISSATYIYLAIA